MACTLTLSLISEHQDGEIGDDWKYTLETKVYAGALTGSETISVEKHKLSEGESQPPFGDPAPVTIPAGNSGDELRIDLRLTATEVDLFRNDTGEHAVTVNLVAPEAGQSSTENVEIAVGVVEMPAQMKTSVFTLGVRLDLASD